MTNQAAWASEIARKLLEVPLPRRWAHTQGVAAQARSLAPILGDDAELLEASAWLHDIGYSPYLIVSGFHPLDGARHLRDVEHAHDLLCRLVAHHSCAIFEARERGLAEELSREFVPAPPPLAKALIYCDMTTSPNGAPLSVEQRLAEIRARYGADHLVSRSIEIASPHLINAVQAVACAFAKAKVSQL
ncbi:HD domain-containing protein [Actinomadura sp. HBU206391]|uniref:HD domain-containing protein n=1 Tax=Actinomadura sp. HBU206391 TaxID=2731692 RepID=UPI00164F67F4|nr:HD domain-containing protein [Actinomadura sp. HBU206391]MBC6456348.1 HD domain-containing protein [Actinomadura sp. HBU206391]